MTGFPFLVRSASVSAEARYRLDDPLIDRYLEFVAGGARPSGVSGSSSSNDQHVGRRIVECHARLNHLSVGGLLDAQIEAVFPRS
jgi:hypothetical protein